MSNTINNTINTKNNNAIDKEQRIQYYGNITRFSNVRTYLALVRTCAVFVGLAIYTKNKYVFILVLAIIFFGTLEYLLINKKVSENHLTTKYSAYYNIVLLYAVIFSLIFLLLFFKPPF